MLGDFITSHPNWLYDLTISVSGGVIFALLVILFSPVYKGITKIREIWIKFIKDPNLNIEISVGSYLKSATSSEEFIKKIKPIFLSISPTVKDLGGDSFEFVKKMDNYNIKGIVVPVSHQNEKEEYESFSITISTNNLRLKKLKEGLSNIQTFIFRDLFIPISKVLTIDIDSENVGIVIYFVETPHVLQSIKDVNYSGLKP